MNSAKIWPYAIAGAITMVFGFCVATIVVTSKAELDESNMYMQNYHQADKDANKIIMNKIAFDKKYILSYSDISLNPESAIISYKITDKDANPVNNAKVELVLTRPGNVQNDIKLDNPQISNGIYSFKDIKLPLEGRWNIMAKVIVDKEQRYYNLKADTRNKEIVEF